MNKNTLLAIALVVLVILGLMIWGRVNASRSPVANHAGSPGGGASALTASESFFDFGTISMKNGNVEHVFKITNGSGAEINLSSVYTSCMCTAAYLETPKGEKGPFGMEGMGYLPPANETIPAGESRDVKAVYDPNAHGPSGVGKIDRFVYLTDDTGGTLELEIKANVTP